MKTTHLILAGFLSLLASTSLRAEIIAFPAGTFEGGTAASWTKTQTGTGSATTPTSGGNTYGQVSITGTGTGTLTNTIPNATFVPKSLYVLSVDVDASSLLGAGSQLNIAVKDSNGNVVKNLTQSDILNLLGISSGQVGTLTGDLSGLTGKLDLTKSLQKVLALLNGNTALLNSIQGLVNSLVGANPSVVTKVSDLLENVLDGTLDPGVLNSAQIGTILGLNAADPIVAEVQSLLTFVTGNQGPIQAVADLLQKAVGTAGDMGIVDQLLTTLNGNNGLLSDVTDILAYAVSDTGLLPTLTNTLTTSLLGLTDPSASGLQTVKLIFSTATTPTGPINVELSAGATLGVGQASDFDNVKLERFPLGTDTNTNTNSVVVVNSTIPVLNVKGKKVRVALSRTTTIKGTALAIGSGNSITKVQYRVRGGGVKSKGFRTAKGTTNWKFKVAPVSGNARVIIRATDARGQSSANATVYLRRS